MDRKKIITAIEYILAGLSGVIFILIASSWTSPLFPWAYGYDSSWYSLGGRAVLEGKVPYRDFFDLKGPVLFFYEALGQFIIRGRNGIFLIQCISIIFTAVFLYKLAVMHLNRIQSAVLLLILYFTEFSILWGGNTVEELFMPFNMAAIYLAVRYLKNGCYDECREPAFAFGLGFAAMALSKITVSAPLVSAAISVVAVLVMKKEWKNIMRSAGCFIGGFLMILAPVICYFIFRNSLKDFFFASFEFALKRSTDYYEAFSLEWERSLLIADASFVFGIVMKGDTEEKRIEKLLIIVTSVVTYALLHLGTPYTYYFLTLMPLFGLFLVLWMRNAGELVQSCKRRDFSLGKTVRYIICLLLIIPAVGCWIVPTIDKIEENISIHEYDIGREQVEACKKINDLIPEWEKGEVYNLESGMIYYEVNGLLPENKYPVNLPYFMHLYPEIKEEVMSVLTIERPKWIICEYMDGFDEEDVRNFVYDHYELVADNEGEQLYRLRKP